MVKSTIPDPPAEASIAMNPENDTTADASLVKTAIGCLIVGTTVTGCGGKPESPVTKVEVKDVAKPDNPIVEQKNWKQVTIELTEHQKAELRRQGATANEIKITTYDISRLGASMNN